MYVQHVYIASDLMGVTIGRDGHNINKVCKPDGISDIVDNNQIFRVKAEVSDRDIFTVLKF